MNEIHDIKIVPVQPANQTITPIYPTKISGMPEDLKVLKENCRLSKISSDIESGDSFSESIVGKLREI